MNTDRYIRQISLKEFGTDSQEKLNSAKVLVVGAGGLGIPVLQYLTGMGIGTIGIVENDNVDISNLQRQVIYSESDIGQPKIYAVLNKLKNLNSNVEFIPFKQFLTRDNSIHIIKGFDLVVDASDNFPTRYLINDSCVILNKPFVYGALHVFEGQVSVFNYKKGPTYRCLFPEMPSAGEIPNCNENGVLGVIPGIIGTLQALEVIKVITGLGEILSGRLLLYDGLSQVFTDMRFALNPENQNLEALKDDYGFIDCGLHSCITSSDFLDILSTHRPIKILDVRTSKEFATGHLENSVNIPVKHIEAAISEVQEHTEIYLICQSGTRSQKAAQLLKSRFPEKNFINIEGGYNSLNFHLTSK